MAYTTINKSADYFSVNLWAGNNTSPRTITTNVDNDLVWVKNRSHAYSHYLLDSVRGVGTYSDGKQLRADSSSAEISSISNGYISGLSSTGFTLTTGTSDFERLNANGMTYGAWTWRANGTGSSASSNTDGSITSNVSANTTAGFSIVSYTGTGSNATVGHGLGAVPKVVLVKNRSSARNWAMYHAAGGNTRSFPLDLNTQPPTNSAYWNNTTPTSSVFTVSTGNDVNESGDNMIAYCFAEKLGYSKFGGYTGNGNADGPFVYTGFAPAFVITRRYDINDNTNWILLDNKNPGYNVINEQIKPNLNEAEDSGNYTFADFYSNGFKLRNTALDKNASGGSYAYLAFGQSLVGTNNIPATAR